MKQEALAKTFVGTLLLGVVALFIWFGEHGSQTDRANVEAEETSAAQRNLSQVPPEAKPAPKAEKVKPGEFSRALQDEMNEETMVERDADGRVVLIRNELGQVKRNRSGFRPGDTATVRARAAEFLKEHGRVLAVSFDEVKEAGITTGIVSAQAYYRQTHEGLVVVPQGSVTLSFGGDGELIEYSTTTVQVGQITNSVVLSAADVFAKLNDKSAEGGAHVLFVDQTGSAKHAYQYESKGFEVIIDAETGKTLFKRDRRMH